MKNIVVFASGSGSNFQSILDAAGSGTLKANISGLVTNRENIRAINRASDAGIPVYTLKPSSFDSEKEYSLELIRILKELTTDLIVLAGYLQKIPLDVIHDYQGRILNIHPSLLPKYGGKGFYGSRVHKAVLAAGDTTTGCSVHVVTEEYDDGPLLAQAVVDVLPDDTPESLSSRVLEFEHRLYPETINNYLKTLN